MTGRPATWVPVDACTLPTTDQPPRVAEFDQLFSASFRAVDSRHSSATRATLVLAGGETLAARGQRLTDAETACCSFFTFSVSPLNADRAAVALDIEVPTARSDVLSAWVERAATSATRRHPRQRTDVAGRAPLG